MCMCHVCICVPLQSFFYFVDKTQICYYVSERCMVQNGNNKYVSFFIYTSILIFLDPRYEKFN